MILKHLTHTQPASTRLSSSHYSSSSNQGSNNRLFRNLSDYFNGEVLKSSSTLASGGHRSMRNSTNKSTNSVSRDYRMDQEPQTERYNLCNESGISFSKLYAAQQRSEPNLLLDLNHAHAVEASKSYEVKISAENLHQNRIEYSSHLIRIENEWDINSKKDRKYTNTAVRDSSLYKCLSKLMDSSNLQEISDVNAFPKKSLPTTNYTPSGGSTESSATTPNHNKMVEELNYEPNLFTDRTHTESTDKRKGKQSSKVLQKRMKRLWTTEKDTQFHDLLEAHGKDWNKIASAFQDPKITPLSVHERYLNKFRPGINKTRFSLQEDEIIRKYFDLLGPDWKAITSHLPGRTELMVRNRFYCYIKKKKSSTQPETDGDSVSNLEKRASQQASAQIRPNQESLNEKYTGKYTERDLNHQAGGNVTLSKNFSGERESLNKNLNTTLLKTQVSPSTDFPYFSSDEAWENFIDGKNLSHNREFDFRFNSFDLENNPLFSENKYEAQFENPKIHEELILSHPKEESENLKPIPLRGDSSIQNIEQTYWSNSFQSQGFAGHAEVANKLYSFDQYSAIGLEKQRYQDQNPNDNISLPAQDGLFENLLNFQESNNTLDMKEPLLSPVNGSPFFEGHHTKVEHLKGDFRLDDDYFPMAEKRTQANSPQLFQVSLNSTRPEKADYQQNPRKNHLESLMSQLKSIQMLFDLTKREINALQSNLGTN